MAAHDGGPPVNGARGGCGGLVRAPTARHWQNVRLAGNDATSTSRLAVQFRTGKVVLAPSSSVGVPFQKRHPSVFINIDIRVRERVSSIFPENYRARASESDKLDQNPTVLRHCVHRSRCSASAARSAIVGGLSAGTCRFSLLDTVDVLRPKSCCSPAAAG